MENKVPKDKLQKIIDRIDSIKLENTHDSGTIKRLWWGTSAT